MKLSLFVLWIFCLGGVIMGCASEPTQWYKSGSTKAMYERDKADCEEQTLGTVTTMDKTISYTFESCMEKKGYVALDHTAM